MSKGARGVRYAEVEQESAETRVSVVLDLDGGTRRDVSTGIGFLDHMLELFSFHGEFDFGVQAQGDIHVDDLHTVEDIGVALGRAIRLCLEESDPIERYASLHSVVDEALVLVAMDISGRGQLYFDVPFQRDSVGELATQNIAEFFRSVCRSAGITVHIRFISGANDHHLAEAAFKGFGRALHTAVQLTSRKGMPAKGHVG